MWFKILGSVIVIFSTTLIGISFYMKEKYRKDDFVNLDRILRLMEHEISYFQRPLGDIFLQLGKKEKEIDCDSDVDCTSNTINTIERIFYNIGEEIFDKSESTVGDIWCKCWNNYENKVYFNSTDLDEIYAFSNTLNNITRDNNEKSVEYFINYIAKEQEGIDRRLDKNGRLYYSMGILSGAFVVVSLI